MGSVKGAVRPAAPDETQPHVTPGALRATTFTFSVTKRALVRPIHWEEPDGDAPNGSQRLAPATEIDRLDDRKSGGSRLSGVKGTEVVPQLECFAWNREETQWSPNVSQPEEKKPKS